MNFRLIVGAEPRHRTVAPGASGEFTVTVKNIGEEVQHYIIYVLGLPPPETDYWRAVPDELHLAPNEQGDFTITVSVPKQGALGGGTHSLGLLVMAKYDQSIRRAAEVALTVPAVSDIAIDAQPALVTAHAKASYVVTVTNAGNTTIPVAFNGTDDQAKTRIAFQPPSVQLAPQSTFPARATVKAPARVFGKDVQRMILLRAQAGADKPEEGRVVFTQRPLVGGGLVRTLGLVLAVAVIAGSIITGAVLGNKAEPAEGKQAPASAASTPLPTAAAQGQEPIATASSTGQAPPTLDGISLSPSAPAAQEPVTFAADASEDTEAYAWSVSGQGAADISDAADPETTITFGTAGEYSVHLRISSQGGSFDYAQSVWVSAPPATYQVLTKAVTVGAGAVDSEATECPDDRTVLSGGVDAEVDEGVPPATVIQSMLPVVPEDQSVSSWTAVVENRAPMPGSVIIKAGCVSTSRRLDAHVESSGSATLQPVSNATVTATCPAGEVVLGGGGGVLAEPSADTDTHLIESRPVQAADGTWTMWRVTATNEGGSQQSLSAVAVCAQPPQEYRVVVANEAPVAPDPAAEFSAIARCGDGSIDGLVAIGGGAGYVGPIADANAVSGLLRESTPSRDLPADATAGGRPISVWVGSLQVGVAQPVNVWAICGVIRQPG